MRSSASACLAGVTLALVLHTTPTVSGQSESAIVRGMYAAIHAREDVLRRDLDTQPAGTAPPTLLRRLRNVVGEYDSLAGGFPQSAYRDQALLQAAVLSADTYWALGEELDHQAALRLFSTLRRQSPASAQNRQVSSHVSRLQAAAPRAAATARPTVAPRVSPQAGPPSPLAAPGALLTSIRRESLTDALRLTLEFEQETSFRDERLDAPPRVFVDLKNTKAAADLKDVTLTYDDDVVRQVRVGRPQGDTTRVVFDLQGAARHSVYQLYEPYRIVIDFERLPQTVATKTTKTEITTKDTKSTKATKATRDGEVAALAQTPPASPKALSKESPGATWTPDVLPSRPITIPSSPLTVAATTAAETSPAPSASAVSSITSIAPPPPTPPTPPAAPSTNMKGGFSLSRQLGLGISRVVIDAGHGGHDPGARVKGLNEADLVLDIALRLEKLLKAQPGVNVVLTRLANVYVPLEERTAIANREGADLFLSIHANASENSNARGMETYYLNFAPNLEAEKVAARENAGALKTMNSLPDIVRAIALNNKIDESREFASLVQASMYDRLRKGNKDAKDLGVKQAPFMVLIGAMMPSVLVEISFITNGVEGNLLKTPGYRQQIAESLRTGITRYQKALKATQTIASQ